MNAGSRRRRLLALLLSAGMVVLACSTGAGGGWPGRRYCASLLLLSPGLDAGRWLMAPGFDSSGARLALAAGLSILIYWPVFYFLAESIADRKRLVRAITLRHLSSALLLGAAASLLSFEANAFSPRFFGILMAPSDYVYAPVMIVSGAGAVSSSILRWIIPIRLISAFLADSVIGFLVLYRLNWRRALLD